VTIRIGCVPYLNAKPLIAPLLGEDGEAPPDAPYRVLFEPPSKLATMLGAGEIEVGLVPSIEYYRLAEAGDVRVIPDISISSRGATESVRLFMRKPLGELGRVGLDPASRASATLLKVILAERFRDREIEYVPFLAGSDPAEDASLDAWLLIGDAGLLREAGPLEVLDLGEAWWELARLPFVFAVWAVRPDAALGDVAPKLRLAKFEGRRRLEEIARREAARLGLEQERVLHYLRDAMGYDLSPAELGGMETFRRYCVKWGLAPEGRPVRFYGER